MPSTMEAKEVSDELFERALQNPQYKGIKLLSESNPSTAKEIFGYHYHLNETIDNTGEFIKKIVAEHENDFLAAFEQKMYVVQKDMRDLKEKASVERIKAKQESRMVNMEKERDWFRSESLQLDKMNKDNKRLIVELRQRLEISSDDKNFLHTQLIQAKSLNRNAMFELDQYKQNVGELDLSKGVAWKALTSSQAPSSPTKVFEGVAQAQNSNIFEPTALADDRSDKSANRKTLQSNIMAKD